MAASVNDNFLKTFNTTNPNVAVVDATRSPGGGTLSCDNLAGWPTDTAVAFSTYQIDTSNEVIPNTQTDWIGIVSGDDIGSLTRVAGEADGGNLIGDIVEMNPTATWANRMVTGILEEHNQDGSHGDVTADSVSTDTINEGSSGHGVDIDGLNVKDGKITTPAAIDNSALAQGAVEPSNLNLAPQTATVTTSESTSSTSYTDLTTTTDTVTVDIGDNGLALLSFGAQMVNANSFISYEISGANTVAAADANGIYSNADNVVLYKTILLTGLTAGSSTFKLKYKAGSASSKSFLRRSISVIPL